MIITARYASTCSACRQAVRPGQQIQWTKGSRDVRHTDCTRTTIAAPTKKKRTTCIQCHGPLDHYQQRHGHRFCSSDCATDRKLHGQSGWVNGQWHQGSED